MEPMRLPGLERLVEVCRRLGLRLSTAAPARSPLRAGSPVAGHPLDPLLASFYSQWGKAMFASDVAGLGLYSVDDRENELERQNQWWSGSWQPRLMTPVFIFGGEPGLAHYFATVPSLADARGCQPVVHVNTYELEGPYAMPIASDVNRLFEVYSRYLETLLATPDFARDGDAVLAFPWEVPELFAQDERLVQLIRAGHFDALMPGPEERAWAARVVAAAEARN